MKVVKNNNKAFTLVELIAVIVIIGILTFLTVPIVSDYIENSKKESYRASIIQYAKYVKLNYPEDYGNKNATTTHTIEDIESKSGSTLKSPYGNIDYDKSAFVVNCIDDNCKTLVQVVDKKGNGVTLTDIDDITTSSIKKITKEVLLDLKTNGNNLEIDRCEVLLLQAYYDGKIDKEIATRYNNSGVLFGDLDDDKELTNKKNGIYEGSDLHFLDRYTAGENGFSLNQYRQIAGDINCDGKVNLKDYRFFRGYFDNLDDHPDKYPVPYIYNN